MKIYQVLMYNVKFSPPTYFYFVFGVLTVFSVGYHGSCF